MDIYLYTAFYHWWLPVSKITFSWLLSGSCRLH